MDGRGAFGLHGLALRDLSLCIWGVGGERTRTWDRKCKRNSRVCINILEGSLNGPTYLEKRKASDLKLAYVKPPWLATSCPRRLCFFVRESFANRGLLHLAH